MIVPVPTEEVFLILKHYLPRGTYMSSAYRSPQDQLRVIQDLVRKYNTEIPAAPISIPAHMSVEMPQTWLPALIKLRKRYAVNAPIEIHNIGASPHSASRVVFDMANPEKTPKKLQEIKEACLITEKRQLVGFNQIKVEPYQNAVHVDVKWVSSHALRDLWARQGYAVA